MNAPIEADHVIANAVVREVARDEGVASHVTAVVEIGRLVRQMAETFSSNRNLKTVEITELEPTALDRIFTIRLDNSSRVSMVPLTQQTTDELSDMWTAGL